MAPRHPQGLPDTAVPAIVHDVLRSPGGPLDDRARSFMDARFGHDFSRVRVHTDALAAESADALRAHAYTRGHRIVFGPGEYAPRTPRGLRLLAHELAHVLQQERHGLSPADALTMAPAGDRAEREADRIAAAVVSRPAPHGPSAAGRTGMAPWSGVPRGALQRAVKFVEPGTVTDALNVADLLVSGQRFLGNTDFVLNGTAFTSATTAAQNRGAINAPPFTSAARGRGVECALQSVPDNEASYAMQIPAAGPWTTATTTAAILALFPGLAPCSTVAAGPVNFTVNGDPSHDAVKRHVRTHEDQHAADFKTITQNILVPWDRKLNAAHTAAKKMVASDQGRCEAIFYAQFIGNQQRPDDVVDAIVNQVNATGRTFHGTAAGRSVQIRNIRAHAQCKNVTADAKP